MSYIQSIRNFHKDDEAAINTLRSFIIKYNLLIYRLNKLKYGGDDTEVPF